MTKLVPPDKIESIVGIKRHPTKHYGRAVSEERQVYILHSQECLDSFTDLRDCEFSLFLDENGIDEELWEDSFDKPVHLRADPYIHELHPWLSLDDLRG